LTIFSRSTLKQAFPNNPRAVAEFEKFDRLLSSVDANGQTLDDRIDAVATLLDGGAGFQPANPMLDAISTLPDDDAGVVEKVGTGALALRQVDSTDDTCLVSRSKLIGYAGTGATGSRPALSANRRAVYFDTTLAASGKPVFWTGAAWVDSTGAVV
jgi:hypothetical protein